MGKKKKEELPPEEYQQKAQKHMKAFKQEWLTFFRTGLFMYAALLAIIIASIAWFVSNTKVTASGAKIQAAGSEFDLAAAAESAGESSAGFCDSLLDVLPGTEMSIDSKKFFTTDGSHTAITWAITSDSNIKNKIDRGIEPGAHGKITFYIISHKDGTLSVTLDLKLTGYKYKNNENSPETFVPTSSSDITEIDDPMQQLLEGHLLLFAGYNSEANSYKGWISEDADSWTMTLSEENGTSSNNSDSNNSLSLSRDDDGRLIWTATNAVNEVAYPVTIYWIWPESLESYLMNAQTYTGRRPLLFPDNTTDDNASVSDRLSTLPSGLFQKMCNINEATELNTGSNRYFYWDNKNEFIQTVTENKLSQMRTNFNPVIYSTISTYYNLADQYLGENVRYLKLNLDAQ